MLINIIRGSSSFSEAILTAAMIIIITLITLTVHEVSHGYIAYKMGDPTARNFGRLTLNPAKHLDPIGTLCMLLFGFGWAKPVPINTRYFKNPRRGMALSALAGPASNLIMAFIACFFMLLVNKNFVLVNSSYAFNVMNVLYIFIRLFFTLNISLAIFNLLPVPPLDGSRILLIFLPPKYYFGIMKYERYISLAIMLLLFSGSLSFILSYLSSSVSSLFIWIWRLLPIF